MPINIANLSAWITVEGQDLHCYAPEYSADGRTAACWIASQAGKRFSVYWKDTVRSITSRGTLLLDGVRSRASHITASAIQPSAPNIASVSYKRISAKSVRNFAFADVQLTDDESLCASTTQAQGIGTICLVIRRAEFVPFGRASHSQFSDPAGEMTGKLNEREKKGSVHRVSLGSRSCRTRHKTVIFKTYETLATFIFRYTSADMLQADGIIPDPLMAPNRNIPVITTRSARRMPGAASAILPVARPTGPEDVVEIFSDDDDQERPLAGMKLERSTTLTSTPLRGVKRESRLSSQTMDLGVIDLTV